MRVASAETTGNSDRHPEPSPLASWIERLWTLWDATQVSHCGAYSVVRVRALDAYCKTTSLLRALAVCVLTPLSSLVFVLFLDASVPLASPKLGRAANDNLWIRCALTNTVLTFMFIVQRRQLLRGLVVSRWRIACAAACTGVSFAGVSALIAVLWTFPIPFAFVLTSLPFASLSVFFVLVFVGVQPFKQIQDLKVKVQRLTRTTAVQFTPITIYPIYSALFRWFSSEQQTLFLVTLPVLKLMMKNPMARTFRGSDMEDALPEITVFTVEISNALYVSACLQMATSAVLPTIVVISLDATQSLIAIRGVFMRSAGTMLQELFLSKRVYSRQTKRDDVSGEPLPEHPASVILGDAKAPMTPVSTRPPSHKIPLNSVLPIEMLQTQGSKPPQKRAASKRERARVKQHVTRMLFNCEYLVLVEYIECVIPMLYAIYTALLFHLPNGAFYPHIASLTPATLCTSMSHLSAYIVLEISALLGLCVVLHWKLRVSALYQLSFALETHIEVIQTKLFVWVTYSLTCNLEHSGMDFTSVIDWFRNATT